MSRLKIGLFAVGTLAIAGLAALTTANAQEPEKVVICHTPSHRADTIKGGAPCYGPETKGGDPKAVEIEVSINACRAHLGDACPTGQ